MAEELLALPGVRAGLEFHYAGCIFHTIDVGEDRDTGRPGLALCGWSAGAVPSYDDDGRWIGVTQGSPRDLLIASTAYNDMTDAMAPGAGSVSVLGTGADSGEVLRAARAIIRGEPDRDGTW